VNFEGMPRTSKNLGELPDECIVVKDYSLANMKAKIDATY